MSQALSTIHSISSLITTSSSSTSSSKPSRSPSPCLSVQMSSSPQNVSLDAPTSNTLSPVSRRNTLALGIASAVFGLSNGEKNNAWAAARRPPATPTDQEKKDPNISGVQAKVLASKKRKEAMKQAMELQRERGKKIDESSNKKTQESSPKKFEEELLEKKIEESSSLDSSPPTQVESQP